MAQIGIFILLLLYILNPISVSRHSGQAGMTYMALLCIFLLSLIHLLFMSTQTTFFGNEFRLQGVFLLWMLLAWAVLSSRIQFDKILHPLFLFGCLFAQLLFALLIDGEGATRAIGTIGEPNALAATVLFIWPFLYFTKHPKNVIARRNDEAISSSKGLPRFFVARNDGKRDKLLKLGALCIVFLIIFLSGSRSGMIAFMLQLIFLLLSKTSLSTAKSILVSILLLLVTYGLPFLPQSNLYEQRSEIWHAAIVAGGESPVFGNGFGNTEVVLQDAVNTLNNNLRGSYIDSSHNIFLDWWVQGGAIGLIIILFLIIKSFISFIKQKNTHYLILLLGLIAALSFNPASVVSLIALWWLIGQGLST